MCGIFGVVLGKKHQLNPDTIKNIINHLFLLSETRGKEAAGISAATKDEILTCKNALSAKDFLKSKEYKEVIKKTIPNGFKYGDSLAVIGHTRLVTDGNQEKHDNNQPVIKDGVVGIHNGIVVNHAVLWEKYPAMERKFDVDSEVIFSLIRMFGQNGTTFTGSVRRTFEEIEGMTSIAALFDDVDYLLLATNNGSLYYTSDPTSSVFLFASESYILKQLLAKSDLKTFYISKKIIKIQPSYGRLVDFYSLTETELSLNGAFVNDLTIQKNDGKRVVRDIVPKKIVYKPAKPVDIGTKTRRIEEAFKRFPYDNTDRNQLRRCTRCILPETMPFIRFDSEGVCNYCRYYNKLEYYGKTTLHNEMAAYRSQKNEPDCIVGISGGRDSTYALHYVKTELDMNPIAFTYDWGMVTDLARRNISRICGKLGVEHILVSPNIGKKREFIRKNVSAWLKRPELGLVPSVHGQRQAVLSTMPSC